VRDPHPQQRHQLLYFSYVNAPRVLSIWYAAGFVMVDVHVLRCARSRALALRAAPPDPAVDVLRRAAPLIDNSCVTDQFHLAFTRVAAIAAIVFIDLSVFCIACVFVAASSTSAVLHNDFTLDPRV
jgi:hypothetical protein